MQCLLIAVGRARGGPEAALFDAYAGRLRGGWSLTLREVEERRPLPGPDRMTREGRLLLDQVPDGAHVVALDGGGRRWSSEDLAEHMTRQRDAGTRAVAFLVGGADGHAPDVLARADVTLSLGAMTWPHMLVRPMLAEQLYRAWSIQAGHPYHRGG
ncbi:23S rRNA (pseudouridine(1915)-N(3))-methyltransferase RlmH [Roseospira marina]|uniref:Ribosomal RNA large subunit methyltransferase H n=1 Tax=Roseospira marina TaxID=140057 RepID=A0A5M6ID11_9PROT|nr:23S rRNA (pseudouridine(1915)-N(3))-methyltransferase RlmH [Roseospira marina]KAA5606164.1 23S rRNA (pseudouridine(1915)-N(3))-methyltransferase RlmH [Roseospira marina]MBB4314304.1 23S rRNA (pseudouridine1915-N3)-methyltransferase [Roseospira marina]MBB5087464.1 23S rRNA (pseudouridine1915-N3)-methyltransferase [Roseospira marina]